MAYEVPAATRPGRPPVVSAAVACLFVLAAVQLISAIVTVVSYGPMLDAARDYAGGTTEGDTVVATLQVGRFGGLYGDAGTGGKKVNGSDAWSARGAYGPPDALGRIPIGFYVYHADMPGDYGDTWYYAVLERGKWHEIRLYIKLNTPALTPGARGFNNGILRAWVNGALVFNNRDIRFRDTDKLKIRNAGQVCVSPSRFFVQSGIYDRFAELFTQTISAIKVGNGLEKTTQMGPLAHSRRVAAMEAFMEDARAHGHLEEGQPRPAGGGYFVVPTVVTELAEADRLVAEEQFGPVFPVLKFTDVEDAIARANNTRFGLCGSVWSRDIARAQQIATRLEVGTAWVNQHRVTMANVPFGGAKESGLGRTYSRLGLEAYLEPQVISVLKV